MAGTVVRSEPQRGIALVTLDRPDRLNAMSHELVADLHAVLDEVAADDGVRVVVLTVWSGRACRPPLWSWC